MSEHITVHIDRETLHTEFNKKWLKCVYISTVASFSADKGDQMATDKQRLMMRNSSWTVLRFIMLLVFLQLCVPCIIAQQGFLSIDCGGNKNYTDPETGIEWIADSNYIQPNVGQSAKAINATSYFPYFSTLRSLGTLRFFPKPLNKSCYQLPVIPNVTYLLRTLFLYGNYSGKHDLPTFKTSVETAGTLLQNTIQFSEPDDTPWFEDIVSSSNDTIYICLIRIPEHDHDPFISSIELRALLHGMYKQVRPGKILTLQYRLDFGSNSSDCIRYPDDTFDRLWLTDATFYPPLDGNFYRESHSKVSISTQSTWDLPPPAVMQTALVFRKAAPPLPLSMPPEPSSAEGGLFLFYFAETESRNKSESRFFFINISNTLDPTISISNISVDKVQGSNVFALEKAVTLRTKPATERTVAEPGIARSVVFQAASGSSLGPIINGLEYYAIIPTERRTSPEDVEALAPIGRMFDSKEWISDPCYVIPWNGITCNSSSSAVRVSELDLSGRNLSGFIPSSIGRLTALISMSLENNHLKGDLPDLSNLTKLERLHLQNNNFSGDLPPWLSDLKNLKELSLDGNNLTGTLPDLSNLTKLERLHLQSNRLSGPLPDWLSKLTHLKELYLENNNFNGTIHRGLLSKYPSLKIRIHPGNAQLMCEVESSVCSSNSTRSKRGKVRLALGIATGAMLIITLTLVTICVVCRKKFWGKEHANKDKSRSVLGNLHREDYSFVGVPNTSTSRAFTLDELMTATQNFSQKIGHGGFGSVFFGKLHDGKDIAVKVLSLFSRQGVVEFLNEVDLLSRVNHKNLVSLLGYCNESRELMLIYEHMSGGSLKDHLYGSTADLSKLDWKIRLKIALDAAKGLEYLHVNCTPKIIHRDVKSANILLDSNLTGKLSDFGLSRMTFNEGASHVTTTVKGTAGYLDPEYFNTHMLTEKSDVYSFGVVLLEIICGRQPIDSRLSEDQLNLIRWVTPYVEADEDPGKLADIVDKRLNSDYDMNSVSHVAKLSIRCVQNDPFLRPTISEIVAEIKEAMRLQPDIPPDFVSAEIEREFEDLQGSSVCTSLDLSSTARKEFDSSDGHQNEFSSSGSGYNNIK